MTESKHFVMSHVYEKQINSGVLVAVKNAYFCAMISMGFIKYLDIRKCCWNICQTVVKRCFSFLLPAALNVDLDCFHRPPYWLHKLCREWTCFIYIAVQVHSLQNCVAHSFEKNVVYSIILNYLFFKHPLSSLHRRSPDNL